MKIDWKKVHEVLPGARFVAWNHIGECWAYPEQPRKSKPVLSDPCWINNADQWCSSIPYMNNKCPGQWDKVLLEFPGHYGETEADIGALEAKLQALTKKVEEGKAASKDLRALSRAMGHIDAFLADTAAMKALAAAGIEVVFKERQQ